VQQSLHLLLLLGVLCCLQQACRHLQLQLLQQLLLYLPHQQSPQAKGWSCHYLQHRMLTTANTHMGPSSIQKQQPLQQLLQLHMQRQKL
jgi:hypothetical protein